MEVKCDIQNNSLIVVVVHLTLTASINEYHGPKPPLPNMNTIQLFEICLAEYGFNRVPERGRGLSAQHPCVSKVVLLLQVFQDPYPYLIGSERVRRVAILLDWPHELALQSLRGGLKKRSRLWGVEKRWRMRLKTYHTWCDPLFDLNQEPHLFWSTRKGTYPVFCFLDRTDQLPPDRYRVVGSKEPVTTPEHPPIREIVPRVLDENFAAMSLQQGRQSRQL
jgi:hypothetical protein